MAVISDTKKSYIFDKQRFLDLSAAEKGMRSLSSEHSRLTLFDQRKLNSGQTLYEYRMPAEAHINAGEDITLICVANDGILNGTITDSQYIDPSRFKVEWEQLSGRPVTIKNKNSLITEIEREQGDETDKYFALKVLNLDTNVLNIDKIRYTRTPSDLSEMAFSSSASNSDGARNYMLPNIDKILHGDDYSSDIDWSRVYPEVPGIDESRFSVSTEDSIVWNIPSYSEFLKEIRVFSVGEKDPIATLGPESVYLNDFSNVPVGNHIQLWFVHDFGCGYNEIAKSNSLEKSNKFKKLEVHESIEGASFGNYIYFNKGDDLRLIKLSRVVEDNHEGFINGDFFSIVSEELRAVGQQNNDPSDISELSFSKSLNISYVEIRAERGTIGG